MRSMRSTTTPVDVDRRGESEGTPQGFRFLRRLLRRFRVSVVFWSPALRDSTAVAPPTKRPRDLTPVRQCHGLILFKSSYDCFKFLLKHY